MISLIMSGYADRELSGARSKKLHLSRGMTRYDTPGMRYVTKANTFYSTINLSKRQFLSDMTIESSKFLSLCASSSTSHESIIIIIIIIITIERKVVSS